MHVEITRRGEAHYAIYVDAKEIGQFWQCLGRGIRPHWELGTPTQPKPLLQLSAPKAQPPCNAYGPIRSPREAVAEILLLYLERPTHESQSFRAPAELFGGWNGSNISITSSQASFRERAQKRRIRIG